MSNDLLYITPNRWVATIYYEGGTDVTHYLHELLDLQNIVERGPNFYLINKIEISANADRDGYADCRRDAIANNDMPSWDHKQ